MSKKLIVHLCILGALILYTMVAWNTSKNEGEAAEKVREEEKANRDYDPYEEVKLAEEGENSTEAMAKVGVPLLISMIYAGILVVFYVLPSLVDRVGEEMMGSTAEVEKDPLDEARSAVAVGDYPEAIRVFREVWQENPEDRFPIVEVAKIQRANLDSPAVAVSTLQEALAHHEWEVDDAAFLMFRIAEIYEEDLDDREKQIEVLERAKDELEGTRHAGNAAHKLRELEKS
ncbi:MAG: hypothetical protein OSB05_03020 [Akkermansiaceae bacterium]|nr:hypothetical protein [Akkermansiaceae bacterium]